MFRVFLGALKYDLDPAGRSYDGTVDDVESCST